MRGVDAHPIIEHDRRIRNRDRNMLRCPRTSAAARLSRRQLVGRGSISARCRLAQAQQVVGNSQDESMSWTLLRRQGVTPHLAFSTAIKRSRFDRSSAAVGSSSSIQEGADAMDRTKRSSVSRRRSFRQRGGKTSATDSWFLIVLMSPARGADDGLLMFRVARFPRP